MGTHSKKKTTKMENGVKTTSYRNMPESYGFHKTPKKKKKAPTAYTMTSKDIINKFKKKTA